MSEVASKFHALIQAELERMVASKLLKEFSAIRNDDEGWTFYQVSSSHAANSRFIYDDHPGQSTLEVENVAGYTTWALVCDVIETRRPKTTGPRAQWQGFAEGAVPGDSGVTAETEDANTSE